ncbi:uncharacterized protein LOC116766320 [Danaus plexippus]|uniref:uncharacterized protein LOC116766320 n=1 Tax=Danaus plexippus TaxID=13037 RepID=UPI002AB1BD37|nr:uncharacterized protein LOC116766320 [Danaus plexippus]
MESVVFKAFVLSMLAVASGKPMWDDENNDYNGGSEESVVENTNFYPNYPRPYDGGFGSVVDDRPDYNNQFDSSEGGEEENYNYDGGNYYARDEGSSRRYPSNRQGGSDYRALKRKPMGRGRPFNSRSRQRTEDYSSGSGEVSNFGNGDHNRNIFHITKKLVYV